LDDNIDGCYFVQQMDTGVFGVQVPNLSNVMAHGILHDDCDCISQGNENHKKAIYAEEGVCIESSPDWGILRSEFMALELCVFALIGFIYTNDKGFDAWISVFCWMCV